MVLGSAKRLDPLTSCRAPGVDRLGNGRRPDEAHGVDSRVLEEGADHVTIALQDGEDAIGET